VDDRTAVAWLHRRIGLGLSPDELDAARARGPEAELTAMAGEASGADPWAGVDVPSDPKATTPERVRVIGAWVDHLSTTTTPLTDRVAWMLHGWLVSGMDKVRSPRQMVEQVRLFRRAGTGPFPASLRAVTTDAAMLWYLDGRDSTAAAPNENHSRELLELFALGVGNYTEDDVKAGARALSGWTVGRDATEASFVARRHDDGPQRYLGRDGVHDVDGMIAAVVAHDAHPGFVARRVAREVLGTTDDATVARIVDVYEGEGRRLGPTVVGAARLALAADADPAPVVLAPVPWLAMARRATGAAPAGPAVADGLRAAGQIPLLPPNVAGWPSGTAWFASSTVVARAQLATAVVRSTAEGHPTMVAAADGDLDGLATHLGVPAAAFGEATAGALRSAPDPRTRLALALTSPEVVVA
jgi:uncharacterized protein (DUF1800 family)